jgi:hypothetical protein
MEHYTVTKCNTETKEGSTEKVRKMSFSCKKSNEILFTFSVAPSTIQLNVLFYSKGL